MELGVRAALGVAAAPRADVPPTDTPRTDTPRTDTPRTDTPRTDTPRTDTPRADAQQRAMTEHILALADRAGYGAALIDATDAAVTTWPQFADTVRAAARGLSRRGLLDTDTVGVLVADAVSHVVAVHAVRAAGAIAVPIHAGHLADLASVSDPEGLADASDPADIAAQLKQCRARFLITSAVLAEIAIQAAERSWVRQVFAFGEAEGATPFSDLLETAKHGHRPDRNDHAIRNDGTGPYGHADAASSSVVAPGSAVAAIPGLAGSPVVRLTSRDVVVAGPPCGPDGTYTSLLDLALSAGATVVAAPLEQITAAVRAYKGTAVIVPRGVDVPGAPAGLVLSVLARRNVSKHGTQARLSPLSRPMRTLNSCSPAGPPPGCTSMRCPRAL